MRPNVKFRVELPKTNSGLAKSHFQQETRGYAQKLPLTELKLWYLKKEVPKFWFWPFLSVKFIIVNKHMISNLKLKRLEPKKIPIK